MNCTRAVCPRPPFWDDRTNAAVGERGCGGGASGGGRTHNGESLVFPGVTSCADYEGMEGV